jgi:general secretion pathway protein E
LPEWLKVKSKTNQLETGPELRVRLREYLEKQGYEVTEEAKLSGKSGIEHTFDILAQRNDNFTSYTIAIHLTTGGDSETEAGTIFNFANKTYDVGIQNRILIAVPMLGQEAKQLAQKQRIKVLDGENLEALSGWQPIPPTKPNKPFRFETKSQLMESLVNLGYRIEEKVKIQGKSGVQYTFDLLALSDVDQAGHSLGIDFLSGEKDVDLEQVSLFDTKAYDVGLDYKAIVVAPGLTSEARQFAQHQRIKVLELTQELSDLAVSNEKPTSSEKTPAEPEKAEGTATKSQTKPLKQMSQPEALALIPEVMARRYNAIPLGIHRNTLQVAMADATDVFALEAFSAQSRMRIKPIASSAREIREAIDFNYKGYGEIEKQISNIPITNEASDEGVAISAILDTPLTQALNLIVEEATKARSSDIHIEPEENRLRIRYRIDGILQDMISLPLNIHRSLISRIKILANLNIADHQRPQDGQFSTQAKEREIDVRVAIAPSVWGEMAVLRLLDKSMAILGLAELGLLLV